MANMLIPVARPSTGFEEASAVQSVLTSGWLGMGPVTREFENAVGRFIDPVESPDVIAVNSGTSALHLALEAIGVQAGDEVIVPSLTFAATVQAITLLRAIPVFCDVDADTLTMNPQDAETCLTPKTKVLLPVHYRGVSCDMREILDIAQRRWLRVVEDAAHAFGSSYKGRRIGSFGDVTCFSFDPIKNITCGEGGAVLTRNAHLADALRRKRVLGLRRPEGAAVAEHTGGLDDVVQQGFRYHMSDINAAVGLAQLKKFEVMNHRKVAIAAQYDQAFQNLPHVRLLKTPSSGTALFKYVIRVLHGKRAHVRDVLKQAGIETGIHYTPAHQFTYFKPFVRRPLPVSDQMGSQILTLPLFSGMTDEEVGYVIETVTKVFADETVMSYSRDR